MAVVIVIEKNDTLMLLAEARVGDAAVVEDGLELAVDDVQLRQRRAAHAVDHRHDLLALPNTNLNQTLYHKKPIKWNNS